MLVGEGLHGLDSVSQLLQLSSVDDNRAAPGTGRNEGSNAHEVLSSVTSAVSRQEILGGWQASGGRHYLPCAGHHVEDRKLRFGEGESLGQDVSQSPAVALAVDGREAACAGSGEQSTCPPRSLSGSVLLEALAGLDGSVHSQKLAKAANQGWSLTIHQHAWH